jgi:hypothetical protein
MVGNVFRPGFPNWLANRIALGLGFPNWLADRIANFTGALLGDVLNAVDHPIFANPIPARFVAGKFLLPVFDAAHRFHNGVALHLATRRAAAVTRDTAKPGFRFGWDKREH